MTPHPTTNETLAAKTADLELLIHQAKVPEEGVMDSLLPTIRAHNERVDRALVTFALLSRAPAQTQEDAVMLRNLIEEREQFVQFCNALPNASKRPAPVGPIQIAKWHIENPQEDATTALLEQFFVAGRDLQHSVSKYFEALSYDMKQQWHHQMKLDSDKWAALSAHPVPPAAQPEGEPCLICGKPVPDYLPEMCCSGLECGCMGQPTNPCVCSAACGKALMDGIGSTMEERRKRAGIAVWSSAPSLPAEDGAPETDKAWGEWPYNGPGVHANFARTLERQRNAALASLASAQKERDEAKNAAFHMHDGELVHLLRSELSALKAELEKLRTEKEKGTE